MEAVCKLCGCRFKKKYKTQIFCSLICSNRFNLNNKSIVDVPRNHSEGLAELFGILLGDGSVTKYFVKVYLNRIADAEYVPFVEGLVRRLFPGASVTIQQRPKKGTAEIQVSSKDVCDYLRKVGFDAKKRNIPRWVRKNRTFVKATIRGLFDTEGSVGMKYFRGKTGSYLYKQLTVTNKNEYILKFLEYGLMTFGYKPTKNSKKNIYLSNKADIKRYVSDIGTSNPKILRKVETEEMNGFTWKLRQ